ncbi:DUF4336 domain-containing protein [Henriciella litoralis]|uniref:DUF4336 domain-containing protein n=1 Tax=Henriciella litoralis TaxID=568102 RepID=UPI000A01F5C3|nr:DUF4336 domain-containing protein [Henriciella litoralis]
MALEQLDADIWLAEGPIVDFYGFAYPTRMVVVRLPDGGLWVWSPISLSDDLKAEIEALGTPRHLVSPNKIHHLFLSEWHEAWPEATLWGPASTIEKRKDLPFAAPLTDTPPDAWQGVFEQAWFHGSFFMDEVTFVHRPSGTLILADLSENFGDGFLQRHWKAWQRAGARVWGIVEGKGYAPLEWRLSWWKRGPAKAALTRILDAKPTRVIMAHGERIEDNADAFLRKAFGWLLKS